MRLIRIMGDRRSRSRSSTLPNLRTFTEIDIPIRLGNAPEVDSNIINGFTVLKICPDRVEFEKNGKIWVRAFPNTQTSTNPKFNDLLQQPVSSEQAGYKGSDNYYKQYRQPTYREPRIAENGTYYGQISEAIGRPKTVYIRGYYHKDGTYVRSHYRSPPRR